MKVYTENKNNFAVGEAILILDKEEGRTLVKMCEFARKNNKRKRTWKKLSDKLDELELW